MQSCLIPILLFLFVVRTQSIFCSAYCKPNSCTGISKNECLGCDYPFILSGTSTCSVDPASGYVLHAEQGGISNSHTSTTSCGAAGTYYGQLSFNDNVRLQINPITYPHYSIKLIVWVILEDGWTAADQVTATLSSGGATVSQGATSYSTTQNLCNGAANQNYLKFESQFAHNTLNDNIRIFLTVTDTLSLSWGIKQYMYIIGKCDVACTICLDSTFSSCTQCATGYKLSGTSCAINCLYKYGQTTNTSLCVPCDLYCITCNISATNCTSCQTNGTYQSYLSGFTCLVDCPPGSTEQTSTHICIPCTNINCLSCTPDLPSICEQCQTPTYYWFNFDCIATCPDAYYANSPNCTLCDQSCQLCTASPSPCSYCSPNYYLYVDQCLLVCPTGFFPIAATRSCLDCTLYCVTATISIGISSDNSRLISVITFSRQIDFSNFPFSKFQTIYTNDTSVSIPKFNIVYTPLNRYSYQIELIPKSTINLTATNFTVQVNPKINQMYSIDNYPFFDTVFTLVASQVWTLVIYPKMQPSEIQFIDNFQQFNSLMNFGLGSQFVQEIKKSGIFIFLLPGAQLSSTVILHNNIPAQNFYEASRFWGTFIYFQVPQWQQGPYLTKYLVKQNIQNYIYSNKMRVLITSNTKSNWRFHRTGFTNFFLFDTYFILGGLVVSWILILVCSTLKNRISTDKRSILYNILHKLHQISLFYIAMSVALEWLTFSDKLFFEDPTINYNYVYASFALSIFAVLYYMAYQVYVFYRLIPFGVTLGKSHNYSSYCEKYSYFLRDLRFEQYKSNKKDIQWTPRHWLRPYNYQVLSCLRLVLIVVAPPIFHDYPEACISCMTLIQILQIVRFLLTWPYNSRWRNFTRISLQICLLMIFIVQLISSLIISNIYQNLNSTQNSLIRFYYVLGWIGSIFVFLYNIGYIVCLIIDIIVGCKYTNRQRMEQSRKQYYYQVLAQAQQKCRKKLIDKNKHELEDQQFFNNPSKRRQILKAKPINSIQNLNQQNDGRCQKNNLLDFIQRIHGVSSQNQQKFKFQSLYGNFDDPFEKRKMFKQIIQKGNLNNENSEKSKAQKVLIEQYEISYSDQSHKYMVKIYRVPGVFMRNSLNKRKQSSVNPEDNYLIPQKNKKQILLHQKFNVDYYRLIHNIFTIFASISTQTVKIQTFLLIDQSLYRPSQQIPKQGKTSNSGFKSRSIMEVSSDKNSRKFQRAFPFHMNQFRSFDSISSFFDTIIFRPCFIIIYYLLNQSTIQIFVQIQRIIHNKILKVVLSSQCKVGKLYNKNRLMLEIKQISKITKIFSNFARMLLKVQIQINGPCPKFTKQVKERIQIIKKYKKYKEVEFQNLQKLVKYSYNDYQSKQNQNKMELVSDEQSEFSECQSSRIDKASSIETSQVNSYVTNKTQVKVGAGGANTTNNRISVQQKQKKETTNTLKNNSAVSFEQFQFWTSSIPSNNQKASNEVRNKSTSQYRTNKIQNVGGSPPTSKNTYNAQNQTYNINFYDQLAIEHTRPKAQTNYSDFDLFSLGANPINASKNSPYLKKQSSADGPYEAYNHPTGTIKLKQVRELRQNQPRGLSVNKDNKHNIPTGTIFDETITCFRSIARNQLQNPSLNVQINNYQIIERKFLAADYAMYSMKVFPLNQQVKRNYQDFSKLKFNLKKFFPGVHVPYLEQTSWLSGTNTDFINNQKKMLELFTRDLIRNKQFRNSVIMQQFLTLKDHKAIKRKFQKYEQIQELKGIQQLCLLDGKVRVTLSSEQTKYLQDLDIFIKKMGQLYQRHQKLTQTLIQQYGQIMKTLKSTQNLLKEIQKQVKQFNIKATCNTIKYLGNVVKIVGQTYQQDLQNIKFDRDIQLKKILPFLKYERKNFLELDNLMQLQKRMKKAYDKKVLYQKAENYQYYNSETVRGAKKGILQESNNLTVLKYQAGYFGYQTRHEGQRIFDQLAVKTLIRWQKLSKFYLEKFDKNIKYWKKISNIQRQKFNTELTF